MMRPKLKEAHPDITPHALSILIADLWHDTDDAKKAEFKSAKNAAAGELVFYDDDDDVDAVRRQHMSVSDARAFAAALDDDDDDETE